MDFMKNTISRYDINRKIKSCLVSHKADLSGIIFSFSGKTASFHGKLSKSSGAEFKVENIENLCKAIAAIPAIKFLNFELEDWTISATMDSFVISKKIIASSADVSLHTPLIIKNDENIEDVLIDQKITK